MQVFSPRKARHASLFAESKSAWASHIVLPPTTPSRWGCWDGGGDWYPFLKERLTKIRVPFDGHTISGG